MSATVNLEIEPAPGTAIQSQLRKRTFRLYN